MPVQSSESKRKSTSTRKNSPAQKTAAQKRKPARKAKKPKVTLAKNKVALLCGMICGICVLAVALSILANADEKQNVPQNEQQVAQIQKTEPEKIEIKNSAQKTAENPPKEKTQAPKAAQKTQSQIQPKITETQPKAEKSKQTAKSEKPKAKENAKSEAKQSQQKKNLPQVQSQPVKQTSQASSNQKPAIQQPVKSQGTQVQPKKLSTQENAQLASVVPPNQQEQIQQNVPRNRFDIPPAANGATIVIVIDDAGRSVENTKRYAALPFPVTIAVLPKLPQSRACADAVRAAGKEVILHQPMQSLNYALDPGPGKITTDMSSYEIAQIVKQNLLELGPGVKGMNNHEGSDVTSNEIKIGAVLEVCGEMGVYFLDSRTTAATKAPQAALERDMHIFEKAGPYLDNDIDRAKMLERMRETLAYANRHGRAIVIGHVDKSVKILPDLLAEMYPEMKAAGYRFATPSQLKMK